MNIDYHETVQIPQVRMHLLKQDWKQVAATAKAGHLSKQALSKAAQDRVSSMLAALDFLADWEGPPNSHDEAPSASLTDQPVNVTIYEKTSTGVMAPWSTLKLAIDSAKDSVPVSIKVRRFTPCYVSAAVRASLVESMAVPENRIGAVSAYSISSANSVPYSMDCQVSNPRFWAFDILC